MEKVKNFFISTSRKQKMIFGRVMPLSGLTGVILTTLLSNISMMSFLMKIKFSLSAWK